jgi:hypothetical protein
MEGMGCTCPAVPTYVGILPSRCKCVDMGIQQTREGCTMYNVQYGTTVSPQTMRDHGGDRIGDNRGQIADLD